MAEWIKAWIDKYIFRIQSPSLAAFGYKYQWDYLKNNRQPFESHREYTEEELQETFGNVTRNAMVFVWRGDERDQQMTVKELRAEANKLGYNIIPKPEYIKFVPCICGHNRRQLWFTPNGMKYECKNCGMTSPEGKTERDAKKKWNEMIMNCKLGERKEDG